MSHLIPHRAHPLTRRRLRLANHPPAKAGASFGRPLLLSLLLACSPQSASAKHLKVWLKAFIPNVGLDIVRAVPNARGHWMIPGPRVVDGTCYNTNDRNFDSSPEAEAKITVIAEFDVLTPGIGNVKKSAPTIGESIRYKCLDGSVLGKMSASALNINLGEPTYAAGVVTFNVDAEASNPFVPLPAAVSPSIKMHGTFTLDASKRSVRFVGKVARFPSYEAYISSDGGKATPIFKLSPASDSSPWSLIYNRDVDESASF